jgi:hypothetical protein
MRSFEKFKKNQFQIICTDGFLKKLPLKIRFLVAVFEENCQ